MSMWYESSAKSQGRPFDAARRSTSLGRKHLAPAGDLGAEVGRELPMQVADQPGGAGGSSRLVVRRQLLEGRDRRAGAVMLQDQLEPALRADPMVEGDLDDRPQPFVILRRAVVANGPRDRLGLGDRAVVGPGRRDVAGLEILGADQPDRGDVFLLVLGACRFGKVRRASPR